MDRSWRTHILPRCLYLILASHGISVNIHPMLNDFLIIGVKFAVLISHRSSLCDQFSMAHAQWADQLIFSLYCLYACFLACLFVCLWTVAKFALISNSEMHYNLVWEVVMLNLILLSIIFNQYNLRLLSITKLDIT